MELNKAGYTVTPVTCGWAGAIYEVTRSHMLDLPNASTFLTTIHINGEAHKEVVRRLAIYTKLENVED